jgi:membrane-associated protease RseP (regulator of RpoE activity)
MVTAVSGSIASWAGLGSWELVTRVNSIIPQTPQDIIDVIQKSERVILLLQSGKQIQMTPKNGKVGMQIAYRDLHIDHEKQIQYSGLEAIAMWARETVATTRITFAYLSQMVVWLFAPRTESEHLEAKNMLSWPIGLGSSFVSIVQNSVPLAPILVMVALLSINLWVINILPFPALDGGRIVTTTLYSILTYFPRGRAYFTRVEWVLHATGFILLLGFMLYVSGLDILRFF